ncbi:MAG TPA: sodium:solute symporter family protein [Phycisphaerae bacterium]|nr:sodium:solute symporter family protein [Phycisphaerae bacterium]HOI54222.1 sodium:solute symporter family protein [Phycisphaerae bacterium]
MPVAQAVGIPEILVTLLYLLVVGYLGWLGYRGTKTAADYMVAGRKAHPFVMAMSYGATFISTSAIVGFGGVAGMFGMSLMWLVFLNIFMGVFIAFVVFGERTRRMGHRLEAHTFPELLGRRFQSRAVQILSGLVIFLFVPLYAGAVLIGGSEFLHTQFNLDYGASLLILSVIVAAYVIAGGLKGVMYTDALQGTIMVVGMIVLLVATYVILGGVEKGHGDLKAMGDQAFVGFKMIGQRGWTAWPEAGWGDRKYDLWWIVGSTLLLGVGIGVLAQPQLVVRFMTVKSKRELNRAVILGGIFMLVMPGVAYTVGALSNVYFFQHEEVRGRLVSVSEDAAVITKKERGVEKVSHCRLLHIDTSRDGKADTHLIEYGLGNDAAIMPRAEVASLPDGDVSVRPRATGFTRAVVQAGDRWMLNSDSIIPIYVSRAMPKWFGLLFLLTLLAAAMSTLSSQFHTLGTSLGRDVWQQLLPGGGDQAARTVPVVRIGIIVGIVLAAIVAYFARGGYIVARATSIFFGLCASAFLPAFVGGLFFRRMTRPAAIASMIVGFAATALWLLLVKAQEAAAIGLVFKLTGGKASILADFPNWPVVDPILVALPLSILTAVVVSLMTRPPDNEHLDRCFGPRP